MRPSEKRRLPTRLPTRLRQPLEAPRELNGIWALGFLADAPYGGRKFRVLKCDRYHRVRAEANGLRDRELSVVETFGAQGGIPGQDEPDSLVQSSRWRLSDDPDERLLAVQPLMIKTSAAPRCARTCARTPSATIGFER